MQIDKTHTHLLAPVVDSVLTRFNDEKTRPEAAAAAVALLQAMRAMGIFLQPVSEKTRAYAGDVGGVAAIVPAQDGQRARIQNAAEGAVAAAARA